MSYFQQFSSQKNMNMMIKCMWIQLLITGWTFTSVYSACELSSRIKRHDSEVTELQTNQPCALTLTARNNKQVVVVMYEVTTDCINKASVAIYDGNSTNGTLLTTKCQAHPWSFASRTQSLTLTPLPGKPLRPFSLDINSLNTIQDFTEPTGTIRSERFKGYISEFPNALTTPNNFHTFYRIMMDEHVTISIFFREFYVNPGVGGACPDYVEIHGRMDTSKFCGYLHSSGKDRQLLPPNITKVTDEISIEFQTDSHVTYTGFDAEYFACFEKRNESEGLETFTFPIYHLGENMRCFLQINSGDRRRMKLNMRVGSNIKGRGCNDTLRVIADDHDITNTTLENCLLNANMSFNISFITQLRLVFNSTSRLENVTGTYITEKIPDESTSGRLSSSPIMTTYSVITGSSGENRYTANAERTELGTKSNSTTIIIIAVVAFVSMVAIVVIVVIALRRRYTGTKKKQDKSAQKGDNCTMKIKKDKETGDIYVDNADYDIVRIKRKHKSTPKESGNNIYGTSAEYAIVDRKQGVQSSQPSDAYDDHQFENVYDQTKRHPVKARDENYYE